MNARVIMRRPFKGLTTSLILVLIVSQVVKAFCADFVASSRQPSLSTIKKSNPQKLRYIESQEATLTIPQMVLFHDDVVEELEDHVKVKVEESVETVQSTSKRALVLQFALATLTCVAFGAKSGIIGGYHSDMMILQDAVASVVTGVLAYAFVKLNTWLVETNRLESRDARKIIHSFSAPLFVLFWPIFSNDLGARFFAGVVPMVNALRLILAAQGNEDEQALAQAVSRSGNAKEALGGPFVYVLIIQFAIWLFWRSSLLGIVAISTMAAGDGFADLVGRRLGQSNKWWFSPKKSIAGSLAFWVASTLCSIGLVTWLQFAGCLELPVSLMFSDVVIRIAGISAVTAFLELLPIGDDNWTVPLSAAAMGFLFLR